MKILLLGFAKMKFMPYASFYLDKIDYEKNEVDIVYWNRDLKNEDLTKYNEAIRFHEFRDVMADWIGKKQKISHFYHYRKFVNGILQKKRFDIIISLHTLPGLLVLDKLLTQYKKKYILDYRDSTFEYNKIFGRLVKRLAQNSKTVFVSSDAFRRFLPDDKVETITSHNILAESLSHRDDRIQGYIKSDKIRLSFWGLLRHYGHNEKIISRLGNDDRFEIHYYGREGSTGENIRKYISANNINNVFVHGEYHPEDRYDFAKCTDIILNSYYDENMMLAMGNKYYDGIIFRIPQLCMVGSYMAQRCEEKGVGFGLNPDDDDYADQLYHHYKTLDWRQFDDNCDKDLKEILSEYDYGRKKITSLLNSTK